MPLRKESDPPPITRIGAKVLTLVHREKTDEAIHRQTTSAAFMDIVRDYPASDMPRLHVPTGRSARPLKNFPLPPFCSGRHGRNE